MQANPNARCTVCGRQLAANREYGNRHYCPDHLRALAQENRALWRASATALLVILTTILAVTVASILEPEPGQIVRLAVGVAVSVLPVIVWGSSIYRFAARDGSDLSPLLPTIFVLSALIAAAISRPLLYEIIDLDGWLAQANPANQLTAHLLLGAPVHVFLMYALVRFTVWRTPTFEHRDDGLLFALAAGWGYSAAFNTLYVFDHNGLTLLTGSFRLITQMSAFLAASLIVGFFLGRSRFEDMPFYYMPAGVALSIGLNAFVLYAGTSLNNIRLRLDTDGFSPWPGLVASMLVMIVSFAAIYGLMQRHNALTRSRIETGMTE